jgi:hypothetical protein
VLALHCSYSNGHLLSVLLHRYDPAQAPDCNHASVPHCTGHCTALHCTTAHLKCTLLGGSGPHQTLAQLARSPWL